MGSSDLILRTIVVFHAHPDDEALLTSGTMAKLAAAGHRIVVVVATDGALGEAADDSQLANVRWEELQRSCEILRVSRLEYLGYADSGSEEIIPPNPPEQVRFARADVSEAAEALAEIINEEQADLLISYDPNGGYGHADHKQVHRVGALAAELTGVPVREATIARDMLLKGLQMAAKFYPFPAHFNISAFENAFSPSKEITHREDVRAFIGTKRRSMQAHTSQSTSASGGDRTLAALLRIPRPFQGLVFGKEWFRDPALLKDGWNGKVRESILEGLE